MTYEIQLARNANNYLEKLDAKTQERFAVLFEQLAESPLQHSKQLSGLGGRRSARVGGWRIIFQVDSTKRVIFVSDVGPRGQIYRETGR